MFNNPRCETYKYTAFKFILFYVVRRQSPEELPRLIRCSDWMLENETSDSLFRRAERSLIAQGQVKMISFFYAVRDMPLRFISPNLIFPAPIGRIYLIFVKTLQRVKDPLHSKLWAAEKIL